MQSTFSITSNVITFTLANGETLAIEVFRNGSVDLLPVTHAGQLKRVAASKAVALAVAAGTPGTRTYITGEGLRPVEPASEPEVRFMTPMEYAVKIVLAEAQEPVAELSEASADEVREIPPLLLSRSYQGEFPMTAKGYRRRLRKYLVGSHEAPFASATLIVGGVVYRVNGHGTFEDHTGWDQIPLGEVAGLMFPDFDYYEFVRSL
ncbi:MAG TPA: hypothetical protein VEA59_03305 [Patescibacteria group bacterium]|nr:hypothetical protein [Patescibacteria group bacterium]